MLVLSLDKFRGLGCIGYAHACVICIYILCNAQRTPSCKSQMILRFIHIKPLRTIDLN